MQMIERPWGVAAYGAASVKAMPDLVRVRFKVAASSRPHRARSRRPVTRCTLCARFCAGTVFLTGPCSGPAWA